MENGESWWHMPHLPSSVVAWGGTTQESNSIVPVVVFIHWADEMYVLF